MTLPKVSARRAGGRHDRPVWSVGGSTRSTRPGGCGSRSRWKRRRRYSRPDGTATVARLIQAADGRLTGLHYGTYDYSAACGIAAGYQSLEHPAADYAKAVMQVAAAGTGVRLSDGSTNVLPVGDTTAVHAAWALHARLVRRSLERGFYQGWDLHPAQLPTRYAATYGFYRDGRDAATARLAAYLGSGVARHAAACWTNRPRPGRWPASCCAAAIAARWTRTRSGCRWRRGNRSRRERSREAS